MTDRCGERVAETETVAADRPSRAEQRQERERELGATPRRESNKQQRRLFLSIRPSHPPSVQGAVVLLVLSDWVNRFGSEGGPAGCAAVCRCRRRAREGAQQCSAERAEWIGLVSSLPHCLSVCVCLLCVFAGPCASACTVLAGMPCSLTSSD